MGFWKVLFGGKDMTPEEEQQEREQKNFDLLQLMLCQAQLMAQGRTARGWAAKKLPASTHRNQPYSVKPSPEIQWRVPGMFVTCSTLSGRSGGEKSVLERKIAKANMLPILAIGGSANYNRFVEDWRSRVIGFVGVQMPLSTFWSGMQGIININNI